MAKPLDRLRRDLFGGSFRGRLRPEVNRLEAAEKTAQYIRNVGVTDEDREKLNKSVLAELKKERARVAAGHQDAQEFVNRYIEVQKAVRSAKPFETGLPQGEKKTKIRGQEVSLGRNFRFAPQVVKGVSKDKVNEPPMTDLDSFFKGKHEDEMAPRRERAKKLAGDALTVQAHFDFDTVKGTEAQIASAAQATLRRNVSFLKTLEQATSGKKSIANRLVIDKQNEGRRIDLEGIASIQNEVDVKQKALAYEIRQAKARNDAARVKQLQAESDKLNTAWDWFTQFDQRIDSTVKLARQNEFEENSDGLRDTASNWAIKAQDAAAGELLVNHDMVDAAKRELFQAKKQLEKAKELSLGTQKQMDSIKKMEASVARLSNAATKLSQYRIRDANISEGEAKRRAKEVLETHKREGRTFKSLTAADAFIKNQKAVIRGAPDSAAAKAAEEKLERATRARAGLLRAKSTQEEIDALGRKIQSLSQTARSGGVGGEDAAQLAEQLRSQQQEMRTALKAAYETGEFDALSGASSRYSPSLLTRLWRRPTSEVRYHGTRFGKFVGDATRPIRNNDLLKSFRSEVQDKANAAGYLFLARSQAKRYRRQEEQTVEAQRTAKSGFWSWWYRFSNPVRWLMVVSLTFAPVMVPLGLLQYAGWAFFAFLSFLINGVYSVLVNMANLVLFGFLSGVNVVGQVIQGFADNAARAALSNFGPQAVSDYVSLKFGYAVGTIQAAPLIDPRLYFPTVFNPNSILSVGLEFLSGVPWLVVAGVGLALAIFVPLILMEDSPTALRWFAAVMFGILVIPAVVGQVFLQQNAYHAAAELFKTGDSFTFTTLATNLRDQAAAVFTSPVTPVQGAAH